MKTLLGMVLIVGLSVASAGAQYGSRPSGSYTRSCDNIQMIGSVLTANCKSQNGVTIRTRLYVRDCWGDVSNDMGELQCSDRRPPSGSYSQSCRSCRSVGSALQCTCRDTKSAEIRTTLDLSSCEWNKSITNKDGHLQCD